MLRRRCCRISPRAARTSLASLASQTARRVRRILDASGWSEIDIEPIDVPCSLPEDALVGYVSQLGPVGRTLQQADDDLRARVIAAVRPAFDPYVRGAQVVFMAACWMIAARASTAR